MGKLKYGIATIAIAGIVGGSIPYITKNSVDNSIQQKQNELQKDGETTAQPSRPLQI